MESRDKNDSRDKNGSRDVPISAILYAEFVGIALSSAKIRGYYLNGIIDLMFTIAMVNMIC